MNKRIRKTSLLTFALFFIPSVFVLLLNSCCNCDDPDNTCIFVKGMEVTAVDNADSVEKAIVNNEVIAKALLLRLNVFDSTTSTCSHYQPAMGWANMAYACKCDLGDGGIRTMIKEYKLYSDHDFDAAHPAGTNLLDLFYLTEKKQVNATGTFHYYLTQAPDIAGTHTFTFILKLTNGREFITQTPPLKLLK